MAVYRAKSPAAGVSGGAINPSSRDRSSRPASPAAYESLAGRSNGDKTWTFPVSGLLPRAVRSGYALAA